MLGKLGPVEYQACAKWAMDFLGWNEDRKLTKAEEERFQNLVFARARSIRHRNKHTIAIEPITQTLSEALSGLPPADGTPIEVKLLKSLQGTKVGDRARTQFRIGPYFADIAFPDVRLCIECDGRDYHTSPADRERDQKRNDYMAKLGWRVRRFRGRDIFHAVDECVKVVLADLKALGTNLD